MRHGRWNGALAPSRAARREAPLALVAGLMLGALVVCSLLPGALSARERSLGVVYADGRQTEDVPLAKLESGSDELFVSAYDLARIFKATKFWNPASRKLVLRIGEHRYMFTIDTRVVVVDEAATLMRIPVRYSEGSIMIPLEFISAVLSPREGEKAAFDEKRLLLSIGSPAYNVTGIRLVEDAAGSRAILNLTEELLYHVDSETPGLLRLKVYGGRLNPSKYAIPQGKGLFNRVRAEQTEHDAYILFDVKKSVKSYRVDLENGQAPGSKRLVLVLERGSLPEIPGADFAGKQMVEMLDEGAKRKIIEPVRTIAVDAGHGGTDNGRASSSGVLEKDVNFQIAALLAERLSDELGVTVVMTRTADTLVPFDRRIEIANTAGANLFISIHCNGWFTPEAGGFEAFFLAPARTEDEARLERDENAAAGSGEAGFAKAEEEIDFLLWDTAQNEYINESSDLAEMIQRELSKALDIRNRGVKQAGLRVLKGLTMPGVLLEVGFLSNPAEEALLIDPAFRERVVEGIVEAVRKFQARYQAPPGQ